MALLSPSLRRVLNGKKVALQKYGEPNEELNNELRRRGAELLQTSINRWALPDYLEPLKDGINAILNGETNAVLFTSKTQANHVMEVAEKVSSEEELREALENVFAASIGPVFKGTVVT